jgi:putative flippase GtrA
MTLVAFAARTVRYGIVGAICAVANNVLMIAGDRVGIHYVITTTIAFLVVTPAGYLMHAAFTFRERRSWAGFFRFTAGIALGFPVSLLLMAILCSGLGQPVVIAAPVMTVLLIVWTYASTHWALLSRRRAR